MVMIDKQLTFNEFLNANAVRCQTLTLTRIEGRMTVRAF